MAEFASKGVAGSGLGLGIAGTALGVLNGGLGNILGGMGGCMNGCGNNAYVNRYEMNLQQELAAKDAKIGLLEADTYTDKKMLELTNQVYSDFRLLGDRLDRMDRRICENEKDNAVYAASTNATIGCMANQISGVQAILAGLTKTVIPSDNVCPQPMAMYNSWTAPTA